MPSEGCVLMMRAAGPAKAAAAAESAQSNGYLQLTSVQSDHTGRGNDLFDVFLPFRMIFLCERTETALL